MELGMHRFVAQTIDMYRRGFDSRRMLLQVVFVAILLYSLSINLMITLALRHCS